MKDLECFATTKTCGGVLSSIQEEDPGWSCSYLILFYLPYFQDYEVHLKDLMHLTV